MAMPPHTTGTAIFQNPGRGGGREQTKTGANRPYCGMQMLNANLQGTRLQSNKVRTKGSSVTLP